MYVGPVRRKKINLWLLILIVLFIVAVIFTVIHISNSSKANSDSRYSERSTNQNNMVNREVAGSKIGKIDSYESFGNIESSPETQTSMEIYNEIPNHTPIYINNHTYKLQDLGNASIQGTNPNQYVELKKGNILYRITTSNSSFSETLAKDNLKSYIEDTYDVQVTSELKTGNVNDIEIIICTMAKSSDIGYFVITPLNDSEILCLKIYDANNMYSLLQDLSEPINDIKSIKSNIQ
ncbi:MAG: hypothetical protein IJH12_03945 [Clostridia bacterium]|nr:hypothetical protein [Clostridia bacterium]